ncbi:MAG TPA: hypothetical protein VNO21_15400, partial [Polyangiaceae bacterium]|nr:hypothetical protein [Polyangiaceae bacterium]
YACGGDHFTTVDLGGVDASFDAAADHAVAQDAGGAADANDSAAPVSCSSYCARATNACGDMPYTSVDVCNAECQALPLNGAELGDTIACRYQQLPRAAQNDKACIAAGPSGGDQCGTRCDAYCNFVAVLCAGRDPFAGHDCVMECQGIPFVSQYTEYDQRQSNTLNCRQGQMQNAWAAFVTSGGATASAYCPTFGVNSSACK